MQDLNINIQKKENASNSPSPIKRTRGHDENSDPSPKKLKIDFSAGVPADSLRNKAGLPKRLFATEQVPDSETATTITSIADRLGITAPNLELLIAHGVDVHHIDRRELLASANQLKFSETELIELLDLSDGQLLARVSLTAKLAQSGVPEHVLSAARTYREQGIIVKLLDMLKAQHDQLPSSLQGAERWRQLLGLPEGMFPSGWNPTQEDANRHIYLICKALSAEMTIADIELVIAHNRLQQAVGYIENPRNLNVSSQYIQSLIQPGFLPKFVVNCLIYDMPVKTLELETCYAVCDNWRKAKLLGFSTYTLLKGLEDHQSDILPEDHPLDLLIKTGEEAHLANVPKSIIERVAHAAELSEFLKLSSAGFPFNYNLLTQMWHKVPGLSLHTILTLCNEVRQGLDPKLNPPEKFDERLLQYHRLCQYGFNSTQTGLIGRRAAEVLESFDERCQRVYKQVELGVILNTAHLGLSLEHVWPILDLIQNSPWMESTDTNLICWIENIVLFSNLMGAVKTIEDGDKATLTNLFLSGLNSKILREIIVNPDDSLRQDMKTSLAWLTRVKDCLSRLHVSPAELVNEKSLQDLQDRLLHHQLAEKLIQDYSKFWNIKNNTWELKSDPSITVSRQHLDKAIVTAFQVHRTVAASNQKSDTVVDVSPDKFGGNKLVLRTRANVIDPIYISSQFLGQGSYGVVHKAVNAAGKVIATKSARPSGIGSTISEYITLKSIYKTEQSITGLQPLPFGSIRVIDAPNVSFFAIVNELFSHNLWEETYGQPAYNNQPVTQMIPNRNIPHIADEYLNVLMQLAEGLAYLHSQNFTHHDIKPLNIGVNLSTRSVFHIDLGAAQSSIIKEGYNPHLTAPTWWYTQKADVAEHRRAFGAGDFERYKLAVEKMDIYGLGISFHEFLTKSIPFKGLKDNEFPKPQNFVFNRLVFQENHVPDSLIDLVADMIQLEIEKRPSAADVVERLKQIKRAPAEPNEVVA